MAQEGSEGSVANSSSTSNYWELQTNSLSNSWTNVIPWKHPPNFNSNSSCEEDISISNSFTTTSNHSGLSDDSSHNHQLVAPASSSNELTGKPTSENHLWNQVLLNVGSSGDLHNSQDVAENFLEGLSSKNLSTEMFEPACDYLKKINGWEFPMSPTFNNLQKQLISFNGGIIEHERLNNLSNLVSNWSIAPPFPEANCQLSTPSTTSDIPMNSIHLPYPKSDLSHHQMKQTYLSNSSSYGSYGVAGSIGESTNNPGFFPCYGHELLRVENQQQEMESAEHATFRRSFKTNSIRNQMGSNSSVTGGNKQSYYGIPDVRWSSTKNLSDIISFNGFLNKPLVNIQASKHSSKVSSSPESKKHGPENSSLVTGSGITSGSEGKKKRSEDTSETVFKKPKQETFTVSSLKAQVPKVKLTDRITALQQIVSPFGKTDTASVLQEAIGYIKFLQEQVQLLSNPYVKPNTNKDPWGLLERKDTAAIAEAKVDLKSRGLCLVPISCTPQVYSENNGSDYWTPTYRGSLYR